MTRDRTAIVVGGGLYGCVIAIHLAERGWHVTLVEKQPALMTKASYVNQARLHNGCHYPRSFRTAVRSRANLPHFCALFPAAVYDRFRAIYAIAKSDSKVSARHYQRFCQAAQIRLRPARREDRAVFDSRLVEDVYEVDEPAFNATALRDELLRQLAGHAITVRYNAAVESVEAASAKGSELAVRLSSGEELAADWLFNCAYAAINHVDGRANVSRPRLRHQIAELVLIQPPVELEGRGFTLMDGPFFSTMPFPARHLHSLSHVRYTHHMTWLEGGAGSASGWSPNPFDILTEYLDTGGGPAKRSRADWMIRDAKRYIPALGQAPVVDALFEIKTFVAETEIDDARPILFHQDSELPRLVSILGAKIDNVFDILGYLDRAVGEDEPRKSRGSGH